jgi:hypothetical protein
MGVWGNSLLQNDTAQNYINNFLASHSLRRVSEETLLEYLHAHPSKKCGLLRGLIFSERCNRLAELALILKWRRARSRASPLKALRTYVAHALGHALHHTNEFKHPSARMHTLLREASEIFGAKKGPASRNYKSLAV